MNDRWICKIAHDFCSHHVSCSIVPEPSYLINTLNPNSDDYHYWSCLFVLYQTIDHIAILLIFLSWFGISCFVLFYYCDSCQYCIGIHKAVEGRIIAVILPVNVDVLLGKFMMASMQPCLWRVCACMYGNGWPVQVSHFLENLDESFGVVGYQTTWAFLLMWYLLLRMISKCAAIQFQVLNWR